jgi:hypothetical protein
MIDPSAQTLKKHIRSIVEKAKGEPVGLKTLLKQLETDLGLGKGSLTARKNEGSNNHTTQNTIAPVTRRPLLTPCLQCATCWWP